MRSVIRFEIYVEARRVDGNILIVCISLDNNKTHWNCMTAMDE